EAAALRDDVEREAEVGGHEMQRALREDQVVAEDVLAVARLVRHLDDRSDAVEGAVGDHDALDDVARAAGRVGDDRAREGLWPARSTGRARRRERRRAREEDDEEYRLRSLHGASFRPWDGVGAPPATRWLSGRSFQGARAASTTAVRRALAPGAGPVTSPVASVLECIQLDRPSPSSRT